MASKDKKLEGAPKDYNKKVQRNSTFFRAMKNSLHGIWLILVRERNMRIHIMLGFFILVVGLHLGLNRADWLWVAVAVFTVISSEFLNTIIEAVVDLVVEKRYHPLAGLAKDVAAGGVLVAVSFEIILLIIVFQPYIWRHFGIVTNFSEIIHSFSK
ncbi:UDP kinase [Leuconostoc litchii]|uniref:Diacylglycerol kinase family protein n=1 Tax=Leuconostoc litchii TaxID=1981069 RepID=A0A6P2CMK0_9LACO|nr:diacylglycerol kinase family protein [Leuconostoc litchii]TYC47160.1 diacylglycerol kinase family protein [Leuconostoc litchii]GMA69124.1 UDP kinase [Leuconostoc litchii]